MNDSGAPLITSDRLITVVGLLGSIGLAVLLPLLAKQHDDAVQILLGMTGFIGGYLLTMDLSFRSRVRQVETTVLERLAELEARALERLDEVDDRRFGALPLQKLLSVPDIEDSVRDVIEAAADAKSKRMQFLANRTIDRIKRDREETVRIASGIFRCADRHEEMRLIRYALTDSTKSLKAVAGLGLDHWRTPEFQEYFDVYLEFATSLKQQRVFLVTQEEMKDPVMLRLLERHAEAGVETVAFDKTALSEERRRPIVLFDDALLLLHGPAATKTGLDVHFTDDYLAVREAREDFESLLQFGQRRPEMILWPPTGPRAVAELRPAGGA